MDPLTAISLASAIVQFVDFSSKLIAEGRQIYQSLEGASRANLHVEDITNHINSLNNHLLQSDRRHSQTGVSSGSETALRGLATACRTVADELLKLLNELKVDKHSQGAQRKLETFRKAVLTQKSKNKNKIKNLEDQLDKIQKQINQRLVTMMKYVLLYTTQRNGNDRWTTVIDSRLSSPCLTTLPIIK